MTVVSDLRALLLARTPLMDVRAPVEFQRGAFPGAVNLPLLDDAQREVIGTTYKQHGETAAVDLGYRLATPEIKASRIQAWQAFMAAHPEGVLYCFRGGLRSRITQQWLAEAGLQVPRVAGGYKALRTLLLETLDTFCRSTRVVVISGRTGSGKTEVLNRLPRAVDLEGAACHRGSTFGHTVTPQPSQIDFENRVACRMLTLMATCPGQTVYLEDESHLIGRVSLPPVLQEVIRRAPIAVLEAPIEARVERILADYITGQRQAFGEAFHEEAASRFASFVLGNLDRIQRRLGGELHQHLRAEWQAALEAFERTGDPDPFRLGVRILLTQYYDPMYDYQRQRLARSVLFQGDADAMLRSLEALAVS